MSSACAKGEEKKEKGTGAELWRWLFLPWLIYLAMCVCECGQVYDQQLSLTCSIRGQLSTRGWGNRICRRSYMGDQGVILLWQTPDPSTAVPSLPYPGIVVCPARLTGCPLSQRISCCGLCCPFSRMYSSRAWLPRRPLKPVAVSFPCQSVVSFCFLFSFHCALHCLPGGRHLWPLTH